MGPRTTTTPAEAIGIVTLCFGWFIAGSLSAVAGGFQGGTFSEANGEYERIVAKWLK